MTSETNKQSSHIQKDLLTVMVDIDWSSKKSLKVLQRQSEDLNQKD